jgi:hypothetical protein
MPTGDDDTLDAAVNGRLSSGNLVVEAMVMVMMMTVMVKVMVTVIAMVVEVVNSKVMHERLTRDGSADLRVHSASAALTFGACNNMRVTMERDDKREVSATAKLQQQLHNFHNLQRSLCRDKKRRFSWRRGSRGVCQKLRQRQ